jgi:hypothetical protein
VANKKKCNPFTVENLIYNGGERAFMAGIEVPYIPTPNDCWSNPFDEYKNTRKKSNAWLKACQNNEYAFDEKGNNFPVKNFDMSKLAFVAGLWRIQVSFPYKITTVRGEDMVLISKKNRAEGTLFEYWDAKLVAYNCYGPYVSSDNTPDYIVAKYETDNGVLWGYGKTLEDARAYLGLKVYDEYKDILHRIACRNKIIKK